MKKILSYSQILILGLVIASHAITTPRGSNVGDTCYPTEFSQATIDYLDSRTQQLYPNAILVSSASNRYNCHAYAWHMSEGGGTVWIGCSTETAEDIYWTDGSYNEVSSSYCSKISYSGNHSAIKSSGGYYESKWGSWPLMKHYPTDCPDGYGSPSKYYSIACDVPEEYSNIATALSNAVSRQTVYVNDATVTPSSDISVPSNKTLNLTSDATINLAIYSAKITTSSGTIEVDGATLNPNIQRKTSASVLKGLHPSIANAINDASTGDEVYLGNATYTENVDMPGSVELWGSS